ncbi:response regulator [Patescibacteria group bacterium]|nr:response regulator [Patescibacteria group bacterium]
MVVKRTILVVDDIPQNLELLLDQLEGTEYEVVTADDGDTALKILRESPANFSAVLLDWMMPRMDGISVLKEMKKDPVLRRIPVILQTAKVMQADIQKGFLAGARNYLCKPFDQFKLQAVLYATIQDFELQQELLKKLEKYESVGERQEYLEKSEHRFQTISQAQELASMMARAYKKNPSKLMVGLIQLFYNAIQHGNLGITYAEKNVLMAEKKLFTEIAQRLQDSKYINRWARFTFIRTKNELQFRVKDEGSGFNWENYMELDPARAFHMHGRGIALCNKITFDHLEYFGCGNEVLAVMNLQK